MSKRSASSRCCEIAAQIEALHDKVRNDIARNPAKPGHRRGINQSLLVRYRTGELIEKYRLACDSEYESGYGAKWVSSLGKQIRHRLVDAELYALRRYALSFTREEVEKHVRAGIAWREAKKKCKGKPRLSAAALRGDGRTRKPARRKMGSRVGASR